MEEDFPQRVNEVFSPASSRRKIIPLGRFEVLTATAKT
jgi:hypothetical protein